jgi:hypothetical protein
VTYRVRGVCYGAEKVAVRSCRTPSLLVKLHYSAFLLSGGPPVQFRPGAPLFSGFAGLRRPIAPHLKPPQPLRKLAWQLFLSSTVLTAQSLARAEPLHELPKAVFAEHGHLLARGGGDNSSCRGLFLVTPNPASGSHNRSTSTSKARASRSMFSLSVSRFFPSNWLTQDWPLFILRASSTWLMPLSAMRRAMFLRSRSEGFTAIHAELYHVVCRQILCK